MREILFEGKPIPTYKIMYSLPINLFTEMIFTDYAVHKFEPPTDWSKEMAVVLNEEDLTNLRSIRSILAHGWILRNFVIKKFEGNSSVHQEWPALIQWLKHLSEEELIELTIDGIISGINYYKQYLKPMPEVEKLLSELGPQVTEREFLQEENNRRKALNTLLVSWQVEQVEEIANKIMDTKQFQKNIVVFVEALWEKGYRKEWEQKEGFLQNAANRIRPLLNEGLSPEDMIIRLTGTKPEEETIKIFDNVNSINFVPCLHLGDHLAIFTFGEKGYVLFEPKYDEIMRNQGLASNQDVDKVVELLEAIGDSTRLKILFLLNDKPGLHAIQIAEMLDIHQSTVSRGCQLLINAGILSSQKENSFKCYYVEKDWATYLSNWLIDNFA